MVISKWRSCEGVEERPFMAAFKSIMITGELQLVSFGFEAAGAKAPFIPTAYAALKRRSSTPTPYAAEAPLFHSHALRGT
jgi:hypothetical protein